MTTENEPKEVATEKPAPPITKNGTNEKSDKEEASVNITVIIIVIVVLVILAILGIFCIFCCCKKSENSGPVDFFNPLFGK